MLVPAPPVVAMRRALAFVLALVAGLVVGYRWPLSTTNDTAAAPMSAEPTTPRRTASASRAAVPSGTTAVRPQEAALRASALDGNGKAADELWELDEVCRAFTPYADESEALDAMIAVRRTRPPAPRHAPAVSPVTTAEQEILLDVRRPADERERLARTVGARLTQLCAGYVPLDAADRYAVALAAANADRDAFWDFVYEPPFMSELERRNGGDDAQFARERDWADRVPREVHRLAEAGDADAALALALAYSRGFNNNASEGLYSYPLLDGAIDNDPVQAYRWLRRFLQLQPQGPFSSHARRIAERMGAGLDAAQRAEAESWLQQSGGAP